MRCRYSGSEITTIKHLPAAFLVFELSTLGVYQHLVLVCDAVAIFTSTLVTHSLEELTGPNSSRPKVYLKRPHCTYLETFNATKYKEVLASGGGEGSFISPVLNQDSG